MLRLCLLVAVIAALAGCSPPPPRRQLQAEDLQQQWRTLGSIAAEGGMLARQLAEGRVSGAFAWVEQQGLSEDAVEAGGELAQPAPATLAAEQSDAMRLAVAVELELNRIAGTRGDPAALRAGADRLAVLADRASRMGASR